MFGLDASIGHVTVGDAARFVVFNGDPLSTASSAQLVVAESSVLCFPSQELASFHPITGPAARSAAMLVRESEEHLEL